LHCGCLGFDICGAYGTDAVVIDLAYETRNGSDSLCSSQIRIVLNHLLIENETVSYLPLQVNPLRVCLKPHSPILGTLRALCLHLSSFVAWGCTSHPTGFDTPNAQGNVGHWLWLTFGYRRPGYQHTTAIHHDHIRLSHPSWLKKSDLLTRL